MGQTPHPSESDPHWHPDNHPTTSTVVENFTLQLHRKPGGGTERVVLNGVEFTGCAARRIAVAWGMLVTMAAQLQVAAEEGE